MVYSNKCSLRRKTKAFPSAWHVLGAEYMFTERIMVRKERGDYVEVIMTFINAKIISNIQYLAPNICNVQDSIVCVCVGGGEGGARLSYINNNLFSKPKCLEY